MFLWGAINTIIWKIFTDLNWSLFFNGCIKNVYQNYTFNHQCFRASYIITLISSLHSSRFTLIWGVDWVTLVAISLHRTDHWNTFLAVWAIVSVALHNLIAYKACVSILLFSLYATQNRWLAKFFPFQRFLQAFYTICRLHNQRRINFLILPHNNSLVWISCLFLQMSSYNFRLFWTKKYNV